MLGRYSSALRVRVRVRVCLRARMCVRVRVCVCVHARVHDVCVHHRRSQRAADLRRVLPYTYLVKWYQRVLATTITRANTSRTNRPTTTSILSLADKRYIANTRYITNKRYILVRLLTINDI